VGRAGGRPGPLGEDLEPLPLGGLAESPVETHKLVTRGTTTGPHESRGELQSIRAAERMQQKHAPSDLADLMAWLNLGPVSGETSHGLPGVVFVGAGEDVVASSPREGRIAFHRCRPPDDEGPVLLRELPHDGSW